MARKVMGKTFQSLPFDTWQVSGLTERKCDTCYRKCIEHVTSNSAGAMNSVILYIGGTELVTVAVAILYKLNFQRALKTFLTVPCRDYSYQWWANPDLDLRYLCRPHAHSGGRNWHKCLVSLKIWSDFDLYLQITGVPTIDCYLMLNSY